MNTSNMSFERIVEAVRDELRLRGRLDELKDPCPGANREIATYTEGQNENASGFSNTVYAIYAPKVFRVKIGISHGNLLSRLSALKSCSPIGLELMDVIPYESKEAVKKAESALLLKLLKWRWSGEWHDESLELWEILGNEGFISTPMTTELNNYLDRRA